MGRARDMKTGLMFAVTALFVGAGCAGGSDEEDTSSTEQLGAASYVALDDATTPGGTQGFFIFSPWGTVTDATAFPGTPFAFATSRLKGEIVHLASCDPNGPTEDASVFATLGVTAAAGSKFQISKNTASIGTGLVSGQCYRVKLKLDNVVMGFSDVQMVVGAAAATAPFHRLVVGSNFTLRFRTESSLNTDTDADTVPDWRDNCPADSNTNQQDTDNDGIGDVCEPVVDNCPNDPNKTEPGECGCGVVETGDTDGDGAHDCNEDCDTDPFKTGSGGCGCGQIDVDVDGDGTVDSCATVGQRCI